MNSATRCPAAALRRAVRGTLTAALFLGAGWGLAAPAGAAPPTAAVPLAPVDTEPYAVSGSWQGPPAHGFGGRPYGGPGSWASPVANSQVSAPYGIRGDWAAGHHTGIDLAVPVGTPVRSVGSGTVVFAGDYGDYGKSVVVRMRDGKYALFAHLSEHQVREGEQVWAGTLLGRSGNTGRSTGPHLHFEVRTERGYGSDVDPVSYLARHGVAIG